MGLDRQKIIRTLRLSLTCIFLFLMTWYYQVPESAWSLITIFFVMYEYDTVGGVFTKSVLRFTGTTLSAVYGVIIVYFCANNPLINIIALVPGLFFYAYFFMGGDKTYIGTIGAVTLTIVLLNYNDIDSAIVRVFNIIIGIAASMLMMRFFYPKYARNSILETQSNLIFQLSVMLEDYLDPSKSLTTIKTEYLDYEHKTLEIFASFHRIIIEAKMETKKASFFIPHAMAAMQQIRLLFRLFSVFIYYLSTDDIRADPSVRDDLRELLTHVQAIQRKLLRLPDELNVSVSTPVNLKKEEIIIDTQNMQNKQLTEDILISMRKEVDLLDDEVKKIVLIYDIYNVSISHRI